MALWVRSRSGNATNIEATQIPCTQGSQYEDQPAKIQNSLRALVCSHMQTTDTQHDAQRAMHGAHPGDNLKYEVMPSPLHRVQEQIFELGGPWRMRDETQKVCDGHTRNEQTYSRERKLCDVVVHLLYSDSILSLGLKPVTSSMRVTRPQESV